MSLPVAILVGLVIAGGVSVFVTPLAGAAVLLSVLAIASFTRDEGEQQHRFRPAPVEPVDFGREIWAYKLRRALELERWAA